MRDILPGMAQPLRRARLAAGMSMVEAAAALGMSERCCGHTRAGPDQSLNSRRHSWRWRLTRRTRPRAARPAGVFWDTVLAVNELHEHGEASL